MTLARRSVRRASPPRALDSIIRGLAPKYWFRADTFTDNGTKVTAFVDLVASGHTLSQATDANRVAIPTSDSALRGALSATFVSANSTRYASSLTAADWSFLHQVSEVIFVHVPTGSGSTPLLTTKNLSSAAETGWGFYRAGANYGMQIGNGSASIIDASGVQSTANGVARSFDISFSAADSPDYSARSSGATVSSGDATGATSSGAAQTTLTLGARNAGTLPCDMRWAEAIIFDRILSASERNWGRLYSDRRYGL